MASHHREWDPTSQLTYQDYIMVLELPLRMASHADSRFVRSTLFLYFPKVAIIQVCCLFFISKMSYTFFTLHAYSMVGRKGSILSCFPEYTEGKQSRKIQGYACHMHPLNYLIQKVIPCCILQCVAHGMHFNFKHWDFILYK